MMPRPDQHGKEPLIFLMGATASGKSGLAIALAQRFPLEIVNADSVQVYRGLEIGSAKPDAATRRRTPHHLLDLVEPDDPFSADRYRVAAAAVIAACRKRGTVPLLVGGTGLYFRAVERGLATFPSPDPEIRQRLRREGERSGWAALHARLADIDPERAAQVTPGDGQRVVHALAVFETTGRTLSAWHRQQPPPPPFSILKLAPEWPVAALNARIDQRFEQMMARGLLAETATLLQRGYDVDLPAMKAVGTRQLVAHLTGALPLVEAVEWAKRESRRYAKRQRTWLRREAGLIMLPGDPFEEALARAAALVQGFLLRHGLT